jgi:hypothetical protein
MSESETENTSLPLDESEGVLRCSACGATTASLHTARQTVRSLSLGVITVVREGDLICAHCVRELEEERSQEELLRGPA